MISSVDKNFIIDCGGFGVWALSDWRGDCWSLLDDAQNAFVELIVD